MSDFAKLPTHCPGCGWELNAVSNSHSSLWAKDLVAALCDCWTNWRIYELETGRLLSFEEMGEVLGMTANIPEGSQLKADIYDFTKHIYERLVFDYHQKCEDAGEFVTKWDLHQICRMDPRVRRLEWETFRILWGVGGGTVEERKRRCDRSRDLQELMRGTIERSRPA